MTPVNVVLLAAASVTLIGCGGSGGSANDPLDASQNDPTSSQSFFNGSLRGVRNGADAALYGYNLSTYLNRVSNQISAEVIEDAGVDAVTTINCTDQGQIRVSLSSEGEFKAYTAITTLEFDDCQQQGSTVDGELVTTEERAATNASDLLTVTRDFDLTLAGGVASDGSATLKGSLVNEVLTEFNTPEGCTPAVTDSTTYQLQDGSELRDDNSVVTAAYQTLVYQVRERTRFFDKDTNCRAETYTQFSGSARGQFSRVADAPVLVEKTGIYSADGSLESDEPAQLTITAPGTQNRFQVSATGEGPQAVQVDVIDNNAVRSESDTWDFGV